GDPAAGGPAGGPAGGGDGGPGGSGPRRPSGPPDRYRDEDGRVVDRTTGRVLHDQNSDRTLLSTRAHNRLVRFRGYRILNRSGRTAYATTAGLPATVRRARSGGSRYAQDARQQVRVWGNTVREDGRAWSDAGRRITRTVHRNDGGGPLPPTGRPAPAATASRPSPPPVPSPASPAAPAPPPSAGVSTTRPGPRRAAPPPAGSSPQGAPRSGSRVSATGDPAGPVLPGGRSARGSARDEARARMQELMRRTAPEAERLRQERDRRRTEDGDGE
ncbi:hypothetical protein JTP77_018440, partial [Streptomyces sp. S9]|nr:hypothetical protein [Streptomyces sp. S9]